MEKITRFRDIKQFTKSGSWQCDFDIKYLNRFIDEQIHDNGLQLNPIFQRGHVWTDEQQIAWLEYFLRGGKSGNIIYLNDPCWQGQSPGASGYRDFVCVDGLQRLTACRRFYNNEIKVFGSYYNEYTDKPSYSTTIKININDLKSEKEVLQWYIDMNSGGTPHSKAEIDKVRKMLDRL